MAAKSDALRVLVPADHGSWALVASPLALGLLLSRGVGLACAVGVVAAFLARQPARLAWTDLRRGRIYPRTRWAIGWSAALAPASFAAWAAAAPIGPWVLWLAAGLFCGTPQLGAEFRGARGALWAEALAAFGAGLLGGAVGLAGGAEPDRTAWASLLAAMDGAAAVAWVHAVLGKPLASRARAVALGLALVGGIGAGVAARMGALGGWAVTGYALVQGRMIVDLAARGRVSSPIRLGIRESAARLLAAVSLALG